LASVAPAATSTVSVTMVPTSSVRRWNEMLLAETVPSAARFSEASTDTSLSATWRFSRFSPLNCAAPITVLICSRSASTSA
jgi:hypothetical protein